jgi:hypothetical protein
MFGTATPPYGMKRDQACAFALMACMKGRTGSECDVVVCPEQHALPTCHRHYNLESNSALLALPLALQQRHIFHPVGREVREVCSATRACYGPAGSGVEVLGAAAEHLSLADSAATMQQLKCWSHKDAVQHLRARHLPTAPCTLVDPKRRVAGGAKKGATTIRPACVASLADVVAAAFPQLLELTSDGWLGESLQLLPTTLTRLHLSGDELLANVAHLTALRSLQLPCRSGKRCLEHLRSFSALTALTVVSGAQNQLATSLAAVPNLQRLVVLHGSDTPRPDGVQQLLTSLTHLEVDAHMLSGPEDALPGWPLLPTSLASLTLRWRAAHEPRPDIIQMLQGLRLQSLQLQHVHFTPNLQHHLPDIGAMPTLTSLAVDLTDADDRLSRHYVADLGEPFTTSPCNVASFSMRGALSALPTMLDYMPAMLPRLTDLRLEAIFVHTAYAAPDVSYSSVSCLSRLERLALLSHNVPSSLIYHLSSLSRLSFLDLTQPHAELLPYLPLLTQLRQLKLALYPVQHYQTEGLKRSKARKSPRHRLCLCVDVGSCLDVVRQMRGLAELDLTGLAEEGQQLGLERLLPVPALLQRVRVSREARAEALAVLGPHVDHISSL